MHTKPIIPPIFINCIKTRHFKMMATNYRVIDNTFKVINPIQMYFMMYETHNTNVRISRYTLFFI